MKRNIAWLGLSLLLVAAMVLSSCSKKSTTTSTTTSVTTTTSTPAANTPQYGGTLTVFNDWGNEDSGGFDANLTPRPWSTAVWDSPFTCWLTLGDIEKYGPRGSNQFAFRNTEYVPEQFLGGQILTGWDVTTNPVTFTFHIRSGIMWSGNTLIGMAPRELTSDDVVYSLKRSFGAGTVKGVFDWITSTTALDKYTVKLEATRFDANWTYYIMYGYMTGMVVPPEVGNTTVGGGSEDWKNQSSDGPFIITSYVSGSSATYTKNPNFWGNTTINGKQYKMPFIDTLIYPIIADESTQIASLRTGKIDWWAKVPNTYASTLTQSSPKLIQDKFLSGQTLCYRMNRIDNQYLQNKNVRRALMIGTDLATIRDLVYPGGNLLGFPVTQSNPSYIPIDQLPASTKLLFTYDPTTAKKMLADAGYPNGFSLALTVSSASTTEQDTAQLLVAEWAKIGVTVTIKALDPTAKDAVSSTTRVYDIITFIRDGNNAITALNRVDSSTAAPTYLPTEPFDAWYRAILVEPDPVKRVSEISALDIQILDDAGWIPLADQVLLNCYWPWIQNYYKETDAGYHNMTPMISRLWIDQSVKKTMGF